jgi:uncharacterized protein (UPF0147 family)
MTELTEVTETIKELCSDRSIPKNVRATLEKIQKILLDSTTDIGVKVNSASQMIEDMSLDPNINSFARTQIWQLSSVLESLLDKKNE